MMIRTGTTALLCVASLLVSMSSSGAILVENRAIDDVESAFKNLTLRGEWLGWNRASPPIVPITGTPIPPKVSAQHFQGVARSPSIGRAPVLYVTRSADVHDPSNLGSLLVIELKSRNQEGERLRSNRLGPEETKNTAPPTIDRVVKNIAYPDYQHPGGLQMVGDIIAVPLETYKEGLTGECGNTGLPPDGKVVFYNAEDPLNPVKMDYEFIPHRDIIDGEPVDICHEKIGVLGITRLPDEHYLMLNSGGSGELIYFYRSNGTDFFDPSFRFEYHSTLYTSEINGFWRTGKTTPQALQFVNQSAADPADEKLFIIGSSNSNGASPHITGRDEMFLWQLTGFAVGEQTLMTQRDSIRHKSLESKGNLVADWGPFGDFNAFLLACPAFPPLAGLCTLSLPVLTAYLSDQFSKQEANFNASGGVYITPSGELLYYATSYYNLGTNNIGRFAEFRHEKVSRFSTCGPQLGPNHLGGPYSIPEGTPLELDGTANVVQAWVHMYEDINYNTGDNPIFPVDNPGKNSVMMDYADQTLDRFDDFGELDGAENLVSDKDGLNDQVSSFRFCGPPGTRLVIYDDDNFREGNTPNIEVEGNGEVISVGNVGFCTVCGDANNNEDVNDEATSAEIVIESPPAEPGYAWDLGDGNFVTTDINNGKSAVFNGVDGPSEHIVRLRVDDAFTDTTVTVDNVPPEISVETEDPVADNVMAVACDSVSLSGSFTDPGIIDTHTASIKWGDGSIIGQDSFDLFEDSLDGATGRVAAQHAYAAGGTYTAVIEVVDKDNGSGSVSVELEVLDANDLISLAIESLTGLLAQGNQDSGPRQAINHALGKLAGYAGGQGKNGASNKVSGGQLNAAMEMLVLSLRQLEIAEEAGSAPDLSEGQIRLALAAKSLASCEAQRLESEVIRINDKVKLQESLSIIANGNNFLGQEYWIEAAREYQKAQRAIQGIK